MTKLIDVDEPFDTSTGEIAKAKDMRPVGRIVTDEDVGSAIDWLRDSAREIGNAKGRCVRASGMLRVVKALKKKEWNHISDAKAETEALCSKEYRDALDEDAIAASEYERLRALREAANMRIETWRTESANFRGMKV